MAGLLDLLRQLISSLLYRGEEGSKRLELRNIHQRLRGYKPPLFRPRGAVLLPGLAARLLQLSRSLEPLQAVFRQTLSHEDSETAQRYRDWLVEARLPSNLEARRIIFTYNEMKRMIAPGAASEVALKAIADEFGRYMNSFGGEVYLGFDEAMTATLRLASLCAFDFHLFLRRFDPRFDPARADYAPAFAEIPGEEALNELLDLYFVIARLQISDGVTRNVRFLASRLHSDESYDADGITRAVGRVREALPLAVPGPLLLDLIRVVREDAAYAPKAEQGTEEHLAAFKRKVTEQYERDRERMAREAGRAALDADVRALFEGVDLLQLRGYSDDDSTLLLRRGIDGFDLVFPLRVLKSFALARYENRLMDSVKQLLVEGAFRDRRFQESLSEAALACESVSARAEEFESAFADGGPFSSSVIHRSLDATQRGKSAVGAELYRIIRGANKQARTVLEEGSGAYYRLAILLKEVLGDYKLRAPEKVVNIRVIGGDNNGAFVASLAHGYADIRRLIQIVKQFAVPQGGPRRGLAAQPGVEDSAPDAEDGET